MSRWFRFYDDAINDPKVLKLSDRHYRTWIGLLCVASKNGGSLPSLDDCALMIRMQPERLAEAVVALVGAGLLQRDGDVLSLSDWNTRQYKSDVSTERSQRHRQQQRNVAATAEQRRGNGLEQNRENRTEHATAGLIEVTDQTALDAWDDYSRATTGRPYPRNRRGGWCFPTKWPPGHGAQVHSLIGRTA